MVTLVILDGFGEKKEKFGNAIKSQGTPHLDKLKKQFPHTLLDASGEAVGLPKGVMGNSEVGHLTLGSGRVILQDLKLIDTEIDNGNFYKNPALIKALSHAEKNGSNLHIMGLLSTGGVHSSLKHLYAILDFAQNFDIKNIYVHPILDGRDTGVRDGLEFVCQLEEKLAALNANTPLNSPKTYKIASLIGRIYAMDREKRYERIEKAYNMLVNCKELTSSEATSNNTNANEINSNKTKSKTSNETTSNETKNKNSNETTSNENSFKKLSSSKFEENTKNSQSLQIFQSAQEALSASYENGIYDEFVEPCIIGSPAPVSDNDSFIFFNYRSDRAREITHALTDENFAEFPTKKLHNFLFTAMTQYEDNLAHLNTLYPQKVVQDNLAAVLSAAGKTQFHIAETTKYAHVTFFFNGGIEKPYPGEDRKLIDSIDVKDFSAYPKMRANEITQEVLDAIASEKYDFVLVNFSNPDMLGHTGNFNATKEAIACVEKDAYAVALATLMVGGDCIITADHGNAEEMMDHAGNKLTTHTTNPVPLILVSEKHKKAKLKKGKSLTCIAPTILKLLGLEKPATFDEPLF